MSSTYSSRTGNYRHATILETTSFDGPEPARYLRWKGALGRAVAVLLLIPTLPLLPLLMLVVRLTSPGPAIYRQVRVGRNGKLFTIYKLRTMYHEAERDTGPVWTLPSDPRVTRVGRVLRALHLDEIPQLFNMLRGEMVFVGPRPERPEFTRHLERLIPGYHLRQGALPGITGLAQVLLPADTDLESVRRKLAMDFEYIEQAGLWLDLKILVCTCLRLIGLRNNVARALLMRRQPEGVSEAWLGRIEILQPQQSYGSAPWSPPPAPMPRRPK